MSNIPQTKIRLQPYIKLFTTIANFDSPADILSSFESGEKLTPVAAVQSIAVSQTRGTNVWRELNADKLGAIQEVYPELPTYSLTLSRVALYESNVLDAFGFKEGDLLLQNKPMLIVLSLLSPDNSSVEPITYIYHHCWFQNFNFEFDINSTDQRIIQQVNVTTAGIITSSFVPAGITE